MNYKKIGKFEENPNPNAKIAFVVWFPLHFYVLKNIVKHLSDAEFVVCPPWHSSDAARQILEIEKTTILVRGQGFGWRVFVDIYSKDSIKKFFDKYDVIVSCPTWPVAPLLLLREGWILDKKLTLVSYGAGKDLVQFSPFISLFDVLLADGSRAQEYFQLMNESHIVGVPKFDDWFNGTVDKLEVIKLESLIDKNKKTVLYLPTHGGLSSLYKFGESVAGLRGKYNVLIKFHHNNRFVDKEIVEKLKRNSEILFSDDADDVLPLFKIADAVLSDSSSAMLEAILVDRPLVILDVTADTEIMRKHVESGEFDGIWYSGASTYHGSIEQRLKDKNPAAGEVVAEPADLEMAIKKSLESGHIYKENNKKIRENLFAYNDGKCGERAAEIIKELSLRKERPEPPVLGMAARAQLKLLLKNLANIREQDLKKLQSAVEKNDNVLEKYLAMKKEGPLLKKIIWIFKNFF